MNFDLLIENLKNPALLFFFLGVVATFLKSDLRIPPNSSKFISLYLLFAIGFKGGQELAHHQITSEIIGTIVFGMFLSVIIPLYTFFVLRPKMGVENSGAIAAAYGSVSAVTFVTAASFLEAKSVNFGGHMVAVMAFMEAPAIIVGVLMIHLFSKGTYQGHQPIQTTIKHALTNGSVLLILGSLCIGFVASEEQAIGIKPFTTDLFKGFLALFLLDMGITSGSKLKDFLKSGWFTLLFAVFVPLVNGSLVALISRWIVSNPADGFILSVLAASASYIAVPAAMKIAVPKANPGIFVPMALAVTFPFNITIGMPFYYFLCLF
jgi:hypothetical protein